MVEERESKIIKLLDTGKIFPKDLSQKWLQSLSNSRLLTPLTIDILAKEFLSSGGYGYYSIQNTFIANPTVPVPAILSYLEGNNYFCIRVLDRKEQLPQDLFETLYKILPSENKSDLLLREEAPPDFLRSVLADNLVPKTWKKLSRNPKLPQDLITRCVESPDWEVRTQIAKNSNLTSDQISLLSHDTVVSVRTEIAKRTDLSKPVISQLSKDLSSEVRLAITQNPLTPEQTLVTLLDDSNQELKIATLSRGNFTPKTFELLADSKGIKTRKALFRNPNLPLSVRYRMQSEPNIGGYTGGLVGKWQPNNSSPQILELTFRQNSNQGLEVWDTPPLNPKLATEIRGWSFVKNSDSLNYLQENSPELKKIAKANSLDVRTSFRPLSFFAWRPASQKEWFILTYLYQKEMKISLFELPENVDSTLAVLEDKLTSELFYCGASPQNDKSRHIYWGAAKSSLSIDAFPIPPLQNSYPGKASLRPRSPLQVSHFGTAIFQMGTFALWKYKGEIVGWTLEPSANVPKTRMLSQKELATIRFLGSQVTGAEKILRPYIKKSISL